MTTSQDKTFFQSVIKLMDSMTAAGNYDSMINILALLCLFSIMNNNSNANVNAGAAASSNGQNAANPIQRLLGELTKGDGGGIGGALGALGAPDMLMSLMPLLNNPQVKSKLNPTNIASVLGMLNNLGGIGANSAPPASNPAAPPKEPAAAPATEDKETGNNSPAAAAPVIQTQPENKKKSPEQSEPTQPPGKPERFLKWKTNF